ncbi:MAG TPA: MipA/OmpV family protein [Gammaproteobacteria bacterium]
MTLPTRLLAILAGSLAALVWHDGRADSGYPPGDKRTHIELGLGIAGAHFADYPGSSRYWNILLPIPYFTLKSPRVNASRDGVHGKLWRGDRWKLNVDFSGSVPVSSSRDPERQNMPGLGWIGEVGPIYNYRLWRDNRTGFRLDFGFPVRAAISTTGFKAHHRGWVMQPELELERHWGIADTQYHADFGISWLYATDSYFNYLYGVAPEYATATRPAYQAAGGYGGYRISLGFGMRRGDVVYGMFYRYINLAGASFNTSPLVSQQHQAAFGFAIAWVFQKIDR